MNADRFSAIAGRYPGLRVAVVGDFFLDRYLLIDPAKAETSIETGLPVHNVVEVRAQPGAAGTILNNLVALGVGEIHAVGFCGDDGEGYELRRALGAPARREPRPLPDRAVAADPGLLQAPGDRAGPAPSRAEPARLEELDADARGPPARALADRVADLAGRVDAILLMDQVDRPETGVVTSPVREAAHRACSRPRRPGRPGRQPAGARRFPAARLQDERRRAGRDDRRPAGRRWIWPRSGTGPPSWPSGTAGPSSSRWPSGGSSAPCRAGPPSTSRPIPSGGRSTSSAPATPSPPNLAAALAAGASPARRWNWP